MSPVPGEEPLQTRSDVEQRLRELSPEKRALLEKRLHRDGEVSTRAGEGAERPLASGQRWLWAFEQFNPGTPVYNLTRAFRVEGPLDESALSRAVDSLCMRHPALRSRVVMREGTAHRIMTSGGHGLLQTIEFEGVDRERKAKAWIHDEARTPFDLMGAPPLRVSLLRMGDNDRILVLVIHHIVVDGWSMGTLMNDLTSLYEEQQAPTSRGRTRTVEPPRPELIGAVSAAARFWEKELSDLPEPLVLPRDRSLPRADPWAGEAIEFEVPGDIDARVTGASSRLGVTPFMLWLAAFGVCLHRHSGQDDILIGVPVAGRGTTESLHVVDYLVDMVPLRLRFEESPTFRRLVHDIKATATRVFQRSQGALDYVVENLSNSAPGSLFQVALTFQQGQMPIPVFAGCDVTHYGVHNGTAKFDLTLMLGARGPATGELEFKKNLFQAASAERFLNQVYRVLAGGIDNLDMKVTELPLLSEKEERYWTIDINQTTTDYPKSSVTHVFQDVVARDPDRTAIVQDENYLTYRQLDERSTQLAYALEATELGKDRRVGLYMDRSIDLAVATLGVVKAGAAYVPLDPSYPDERLRFMLEDAAIESVIIDRAGSFPSTLEPLVQLIEVQKAVDSQADSGTMAPVGGPEDPLYVMYTSGSTGLPKGVVVPHRGALRLVKESNYVRLTRDDVLGHISNVSFDAATFEIWGAFLNGGTLAVIDKFTVLSPGDLALAIKRHGVTAMFMTAALFNVISDEDPDAFSRVETLLIGGEALDVGRVRAVLDVSPPKRLLNGYGPTEATTFASWHEIRDLGEDDVSIPIGMPLSNTYLYVLDPHLKPVPPGMPGQIYIGGDGVALGYLNNPGLTRTRFIEDPYVPGGRMYATGDVARRLSDGAIDFVGRADRQVKLRGFRLELGEVEAALKSHEEIDDALVLVDNNPDGYKELTAYVVPGRGLSSVSVGALRKHLKAKIPGFMIPGRIRLIAKLPLTPNGKVDRAALIAMHAPVTDDVQHELARDELENRILDLWVKVLGTAAIGVDDDFFDVGGNSLFAVQLLTRIEREFGHSVDIATFVENPTVEVSPACCGTRSSGPRPKDWSASMVMAPASLSTSSPATAATSFI